MLRAVRGLEAWAIMLGSISFAAWLMLASGNGGIVPPVFCSTGPPWSIPFSDYFELAIAFNSPATLAIDVGLMIAAMMSPLMATPLRHVRDRSFSRRRNREMLFFVAGYATVWITAGVALEGFAFAAKWAASAPLVCLGLAAATAFLWQISPAKQWFLNRCHRRPHLAAFGLAADRDALSFGIANGAACVGACWALMLLPFLTTHGHYLTMAIIALFVFAERLEQPAPLGWRWRGPARALRIAIAQALIRLQQLQQGRRGSRLKNLTALP
jgi:predicted metal-binding membrane protein